jgi:hypothetical protein
MFAEYGESKMELNSDVCDTNSLFPDSKDTDCHSKRKKARTVQFSSMKNETEVSKILYLFKDLLI